MTMNESHNLSGSICDEGGSQVMTLHAGYSRRQVNLHMEILNEPYVAQHAADVRAQVEAFLTAALERAAREFAALPGAAEAGQ